MKYEFTGETYMNPDGVILQRIVSLKDLENGIRVGQLGGFIESEDNLSHQGSCWVGDDATVWGNAKVSQFAQVYGDAEVRDDCLVLGFAHVYGNVTIKGDSIIKDFSRVSGSAIVFGRSKIEGDTKITSKKGDDSND